ncbi:Gfo/Idh/MocA family protein [Plantactinospora sp. CA-290183]|uniref:Gfo/Idh/MocA family protein n=1 Tax=Plantactinospora sp. CA-290183 TaxID=3240006 RepID=UPI003D8F7546
MRTVVIGLGWVAREVWLPRLLGHAKFDVVAAVEPDPRAAARAAGLLGQIPVLSRHTEVDIEQVDLAFVLTPNHTHGALGEWFLRRDCSVFLEKPTSPDRGQLELLRTAGRQGRGRLVLSAAARHRTDVAALRRLVAEGRIGTPRLAEASWVRARGIPGSGWFTHRATAGGGVLLDLGWHVIDVVQELWGRSPVRSAAAVTGADFLGRRGWDAGWRGDAGDTAAEPDVEDQLTALVTTDAYALQLRLAWASHEEVDVTSIALHGSEGSASLRTTFGFSPLRVPEPALVLKQNSTVERVPLDAPEVGAEYDTQLDAVVGALERPDTTQQSLADATGALAVVEACYHAARSR